MTSNTRYNNGKIYKIIHNFNDMVYIGSTCLPLHKRIFNHKEQRAGRSLNRYLFKLVREAANCWDDFQIVLLDHGLDPPVGRIGRDATLYWAESN